MQVDKIDTEVKERLGRALTDDQVGYPNCSLVGNSQVHKKHKHFCLRALCIPPADCHEGHKGHWLLFIVPFEMSILF